MAYATVNELNTALGKRLAEAGYLNTYETESAFERDVWDRCVKFMAEVDERGCSRTTSLLTDSLVIGCPWVISLLLFFFKKKQNR